MSIESPSRNGRQEHPADLEVELEDFKDRPELHRLLSRMPAELRKVHMQRIAHLADDEAHGYLYALHKRREKALRETIVSDSDLELGFEGHQEQIWKALETHVFSDPESLLGQGTTARVQRFDMSEYGTEMPTLAVKYLVTPTPKTLNVGAEHDLIQEIEQLRKIEEAERRVLGDDALIRVPHPYFYYRKGKTQCYGMELVDGVNLERGNRGDYSEELKETLRQAFANVDRELILKQVDTFFDTVHEICLHGDIKPRNLMVSKEGRFYVIDFGQARLATTISDTQREAADELKDDEKQNTKDAIRIFLTQLFRD